MKIKVGMRLVSKDGGKDVDGDYILAQVDTGKVCAICLEDGNRFVDPVKVGDCRDIQSAELWKILVGRWNDLEQKWYIKGKVKPLKLSVDNSQE